MWWADASYPTRHGLPIPPSELALPPGRSRVETNHHNVWPHKLAGRLLVMGALRNLDAFQFQMPRDQHNFEAATLHKKYGPPEIDIMSAYRRVNEAYENGERNRIGTCYNFHYEDIKLETIMQIEREKQELGYD